MSAETLRRQIAALKRRLDEIQDKVTVFNVPLVGALDGSNQVFNLPEGMVPLQDANGEYMIVYALRGRPLKRHGSGTYADDPDPTGDCEYAGNTVKFFGDRNKPTRGPVTALVVTFRKSNLGVTKKKRASETDRRRRFYEPQGRKR